MIPTAPPAPMMAPEHQMPINQQPGPIMNPQEQQRPIMQQPAPAGRIQQGQWMEMPAGVPGCPPGLEYLTAVDRVIIQQMVEMLEVLTGWETNNRYIIRNSFGQQIYFAMENSSTCMRQFCGAGRSFTIHIVNNYNQEVMRLFRPFKCCAACCQSYCCADNLCCAHEVFVEAPPGTPIGSVRQVAGCCRLVFLILDPTGAPQLKVRGPNCCVMCCHMCADVKFQVLTPENENIGEIRKMFAGIAQEMFTDADNFGISFPPNLDVKIKGTLLAATFLIDFMAFENNETRKNQ